MFPSSVYVMLEKTKKYMDFKKYIFPVAQENFVKAHTYVYFSIIIDRYIPAKSSK